MNAEYMVQMQKDCAECGRVGRYGLIIYKSSKGGVMPCQPLRPYCMACLGYSGPILSLGPHMIYAYNVI